MVNFKEDENLHVLNHSCAHMMAQAVKHLYPNAKFWVGPTMIWTWVMLFLTTKILLQSKKK